MKITAKKIFNDHRAYALEWFDNEPLGYLFFEKEVNKNYGFRPCTLGGDLGYDEGNQCYVIERLHLLDEEDTLRPVVLSEDTSTTKKLAIICDSVVVNGKKLTPKGSKAYSTFAAKVSEYFDRNSAEFTEDIEIHFRW